MMLKPIPAVKKPTKLIRVIKVNDPDQLQEAFRIREAVYVREQGIKREEEFDQFEDVSNHLLAISEMYGPCGTARWRFTEIGIKLERFAVILDARKKGVAQELLHAMLQDIKKHPDALQQPLYLHAQVAAVPLYQKFGFNKTGPTFLECGIAHCKMIQTNLVSVT